MPLRRSEASTRLAQKILDRTVTVGIIGLGYVGLPLAMRFAESGVKVLGFDIDESKIKKINAGQSYINYIAGEEIRRSLVEGLSVTSDFSRLSEPDALLICVPTPLKKHREPDLSYVLKTTHDIARHLRQGQLISLESTTYPGTTEDEVLPALNKSGLELGEDFFLVFSPERQDPGNSHFGTQNIPKIVGGCTEQCLALGAALYRLAVDKVVEVSSPKVAELSKLLENIHRAVNIGLVNEMKMVADRMGIDIFEVIDAAATKPFGFVPYYPGPGLGGHCIPIDPFYLTWKAREYGLHTRFIELAGEINSFMPEWVILKISASLNNFGKSVKGAKILLIGIAYKKNVDDLRESPALELLDRLEELGGAVDYHDPHIPLIPPQRRGRYEHVSVALTPEAVDGCDVVVIATNHDAVDYLLIEKRAQLIVDTRGQYRGTRPNIIKA